MINRYSYNQTTWLDVLNPDNEEIRQICEECDIPSSFTHDLTSMTPRTESQCTKDAVKITLDFPIVKRTDINHPHEIKFIATKTHLITIRFEDMEVIHRFSKEYEVLQLLKRTGKKATGGHLLLALLLYIYEGLNTKLDYLEGKMQEIEQELLADNEKEVLFEISKVGRRLVSFRQTLSAHKRALHNLKDQIGEVFTKTYTDKMDPILNNYEHLVSRATALSRALEIMRDTDNALLSFKQNEIMKTLTIMAFITFPLTAVSSIFGMNTDSTPLTGTEFDFWAIIGIMALMTTSFFAYFKYRNWL